MIALTLWKEGWELGFEDEVWWSRLAQPSLRAWAEDASPCRLLEKERDKEDKERKALACYGVFLPDGAQMLLRFVDGRPVSQVTCDYLAWIAEKMTAQGKRVLVLIWDNASWHNSQIVKKWLRAYNHRAKREGLCRLLVCFLPSKSPWLNNIEPKWMHGKRAIAEPERVLTIDEMIERICDYYDCEQLELIAQKVA